MSSSKRFLMLTSDRADLRRREVREGLRPCPEYLRLEERHDVELLDWSRLAGRPRARSPRTSLAQVGAAVRRLHDYEAVFSDGEHVGLPLAVAMRALAVRTPHLMLGHHLTTPRKRLLFRALRPHGRIDRVVLHSRRQVELAARELGIAPGRLHFVPYCADPAFWAPEPVDEEPLVVAAGREHRDYTTLASACADLPVQVFIAAGSLFSPAATASHPAAWPGNVRASFADHRSLRTWYARASVVAVPLVPADFQAGVTTLLEGMSMARAVVVTATEGQRDIVVDGVTGLTVPPGDPAAMREAIARLLSDPRERRRLGGNAREAVLAGFGVDAYAAALARHLDQIAGAARAAA